MGPFAASLLILSLILVTALPGYAETLPGQSCQQTIDAFADLTGNLIFPRHLLRRFAVKTWWDFDPNKYFTVLSHVAMKPGYVLDYVYQYDGMGGYPVLYGRKKGQFPCLTYAQYERRHSNGRPDYLRYLETDETAQGFFEFVVLELMGGQFYLSWHAGYNDSMIVCDSAGLEKILAQLEPGTDNTDMNTVKDDARALELGPLVEFANEEVTVRVIFFTKWAGFVQSTYTISRDAPHTVSSKEEILVPYDCGWVF